jgi:hypothetical protein
MMIHSEVSSCACTTCTWITRALCVTCASMRVITCAQEAFGEQALTAGTFICHAARHALGGRCRELRRDAGARWAWLAESTLALTRVALRCNELVRARACVRR